MSVIISNTTPINYLVLIDHITVLRDLYERVIISQAVLGELQHEGTPAQVKAWVASHPAWLEVRAISRFPDPSLAFLDEGEREAICLAQELQADALIIDEPAGREEAKRPSEPIPVCSEAVAKIERFLDRRAC
jgi:predicted nucleic acid-binding protein